MDSKIRRPFWKDVILGEQVIATFDSGLGSQESIEGEDDRTSVRLELLIS